MKKICEISANTLAEGRNFPIYGVSPQYAPENNSVIFVKNKLENYQNLTDAVVVTKERYDLPETVCQIISERHKTEYGKLLKKIEDTLPPRTYINRGGYRSCDDLLMGEHVSIGPNCVIGRGVIIGSNVSVGAGSYIGDFTEIGDHVEIKEGCRIGVESADIYWEDGFCHTLLGLGGVLIGENCLLLAGSTVAAGNAAPTKLCSHVVIGSNAIVGENALIGEKTLIGSGSVICGNTIVGKEVYMAPQGIVLNRLRVGDNCYIGVGSVVLKSLDDCVRVQGNPARKIPAI